MAPAGSAVAAIGSARVARAAIELVNGTGVLLQRCCDLDCLDAPARR
jgi:hypothetical protein